MTSVEEVRKRKCKEANEPPKRLRSTLRAMREMKELTDVVFVCEGGEVEAHRVILSAQSPYFQKMFLSNFKESTTNRVDCSHINKDIMLLVLDYVYLKSMENITDQNVGNLIKIFQVSHLFEIIGLSECCWQLILNRINVDNWLNVWEAVLLHGNDDEVLQVLHFIFEYLSEIVERNFFVLNSSQLKILLEKIKQNNISMEDEFLAAIIQWNEKTTEEKINLQTIFLEINFDFISKEFMNNLLKSDNDLFHDTFFKDFLKQHFLPKLKTCSEIKAFKETFSGKLKIYERFPLKLCFFGCYRTEINGCLLYRNAHLQIFDCEERSVCRNIDNLPFLFGRGIFPVQRGSDIYIIGGTPNGFREVASDTVRRFFLYDWKKNEIVVKPSLNNAVRDPLTCVTKDKIYVIGSIDSSPPSTVTTSMFDYVRAVSVAVVEQAVTVIQYFSLTVQKWFSRNYNMKAVACASREEDTYLLCYTNNGKYSLYIGNELNFTFHSHTPVQNHWGCSVNQKSLTVYKDKIFVLSANYEWCIFDHYTQHWSVGTSSIPSVFNMNEIRIFSNANNSLMLYNEKEQSVYQFDENYSDIKKVMTFQRVDDVSDQKYSKYETLLVFQSSYVE